MEKQNDYFLNQLYNPGFSPGDFVNLGINTSNTSLQNKDVYKNLDAVRNNPAVSIGVHISFQIMVFSRYIPQSGIAGSYGSSVFSSFK